MCLYNTWLQSHNENIAIKFCETHWTPGFLYVQIKDFAGSICQAGASGLPWAR